ncbi:MAG TPA: 50S ribosomal protein L19 [Lentisphaeria bacterium]|nr:MAG: 50S ribosomal protein L19 [Lentisphaerae bacterium GWF2_49_21]HBC89208.1 50S ribosomal protein L19 [Lentisphaeria bacterium]
MNIMDKIKASQCKKNLPEFVPGDAVKVYSKIKEGDSERVQVFAGTVIARKGSGIGETFTVRRIAFGQGMERIFPLNSPRIDKIEVERHGKVRRAKLYYLREKVGKSARLKEQRYDAQAEAAKA